jgi:hypothetical protein
LDGSTRHEEETLKIEIEKSRDLDPVITPSHFKLRSQVSLPRLALPSENSSPLNKSRLEIEGTLKTNFGNSGGESSRNQLILNTMGNFKKQASTARLPTKATFQTSPREEMMLSTLGMSKASLLGTRQSDFFSDIENDAELLGRFRASQKAKQKELLKNTNSRVLQKNQKSEEKRQIEIPKNVYMKDDQFLSRVRFSGPKTQLQGFTGKNKDALLKASKVADLRQLAELFREQNQKDMKTLENKSNELTRELNSVTDRNEKKQKVLRQLEETYERLIKETLDEDAAAAPDVSQSIARADFLGENYASLKNQETRMNRIIDVCHVNKNQNDEWLSQLEFYNQNLSKCIDEKKEATKIVEKSAAEAEDTFSHLKDRFKKSETNTQELLSTLDQIHADNSAIQSQFMSTEKIIKGSLENAKRKLEERAENRLKQLEDGDHERAVSAKNRIVQRELNKLKGEMEKYSAIFAEGEDGEKWTEKKEMKNLLDNLAENKELNKELMQLLFELKEKQLKTAEVKRRIEVGEPDSDTQSV